MAKEKEAYRDNLELILQFMEDKYSSKKIMMSNKDVQEFTGLKYDFVKQNYMNGERYISAPVLARRIS